MSFELRPWAVMAYVIGFGPSTQKRKSFEAQWKSARERHGSGLNAKGTAELALKVIYQRHIDDPIEDLRYISTGDITDD